MEPARLGRYELVRHLASGGMASVYLARLAGLGGFERHVVLKTLRAEGLADDDGLVPMFLDEARLVATLHHQHIAQVFEVGCEGHTYFLAMEYVHGETIRRVMETMRERGNALPLDFSLAVTCAVASGLHHAHERRDGGGRLLGIVHRDVTPSNVIASYDGSIKLIDFGIAKADVRATHTRSGLIKGKAGYMAPEQVRGHAIDRRSDVFALGVLAYELTTLARAFDGASQFEQLERAAHGELVPPSQIVAGYPASLEQIILTALEVDPDDRYPDAETMRLELLEVARQLGLPLHESPVIRVLAELFGSRPEPWLRHGGRDLVDVSSVIETPPLAVVRPVVRARGTGSEHAAWGARELPADDEDAPTDPIELVELATTDFLTIEPEAAPPIPVEPLRPPDEARPLAAAIATRPPAPPLPAVPARGWRVRAAILAGAVVIGATAAVVALSSDDDGPSSDGEGTAASTIATTTMLPAPARQASPSPAPAQPPAPPAAPTVAPEPAITAPHKDRVVIEVTSTPSDATVVLDGVRLGRTPYRGEVPKRSAAWLKLRKRRHLPIRQRVTLDADGTWHVELRAR